MKIFIDTSAWVALENKRDIHYNEAVTFRDEIKNKRYRLFTSNFILDETFTLCLANLGYEKTIECARRIRYLEVRDTSHIF
jgi:predicted nucleic acid-binding protein